MKILARIRMATQKMYLAPALFCLLINIISSLSYTLDTDIYVEIRTDVHNIKTLYYMARECLMLTLVWTDYNLESRST